MKVAVVGSGYWGKNLVRNFYQLGALELICEKDEVLLGEFRTQYPCVRTCRAYNEVLSDQNVDGVVIATPAETHYALAKEAILAGKGVYVEKPLALKAEDGEKLQCLADEHGVVLMVGHLIQYHPAFIRLKEIVASGELGKVDYIYSNRLNLGKIRREENALWSFAPHDISMILSLANEMPYAVTATGGNYLHRAIADVTMTHMEFPSGLKAHVFVSWLHPFKEQKIVVVGNRKMAVFDDTLPWEEKLRTYSHTIHWEKGVPVADKAEAELVSLEAKEPLRSECEHFLECLDLGLTPLTDGREGVRVLKVLNEAQSSLDGAGGVHCVVRTAAAVREGVHPTAEVEPGAVLGKGSVVWNFSRILKGVSIGDNCRIGQNVVVGPDVKIGSGCKIQNNVSIYKGVTLEDGVFCGPSMVFTNVLNPRSHVPRMSELKETLVREGATLGANCTIVCGHSIGRYAFVGAGAVVTKDVPGHALVVGNPARQIGWVCECGAKLDEAFSCPACGKKYVSNEAGLHHAK